MVDFDVAVVGAGMAGIIAARDLSNKGYSVVLLEGRNRIGGRTYTEKVFGGQLELDMGGGYVHWTQANVWYELQKHNIPIRPPSVVGETTCYWLADGAVHVGTREEYYAILAPLMQRLVADARLRFPRPWDVTAVDNSDIEKESMEDRIRSLNLTQYDRDVLEAAMGGFCHSYKKQGIAHLLIGVSAYCGSFAAFFETAGTFGIEGGLKRLQNAIMGESAAEVRLSTPVFSITEERGVVTLATKAGSICARAAVVACPINTLGDIEFSPKLPPQVHEMIDAKNPVMAGKLWIRVKGEVKPFSILAPIGKSSINTARTEKYFNGDTILMCIVSDAAAFDDKDYAAVQATLRNFIPDIEVIDTAYHNWVSDEFSKGAWMMHRPGYVTTAAPQMRKSHGRVHFAGADIAALDVTAIEGAMETGAVAARDISIKLKDGTY
jgi:monoamine oxidase